jgi:hypothetical protein
MVLTVLIVDVVVVIVMILLQNHRPTPSPRMVATVAAAAVVIGFIRRSTITVMGTVRITSCRRNGSILIPGAYGGCPIGRNWNVRYSTTTTTNNIFLLLLTVRTGILRLEYDIFYQFDGYPNQFFFFQRRLRLWLECACSLC